MTKLSTHGSVSKRGLRGGAAGTKAAILEAAGEVFAVKGFDGATGKEIAERAGTNSAAVNYYYGGIEGLYAEVLAEAHRRLIVYDEALALASGPGRPAEKLRIIIARLARAILSPASSTWALRVLSREITSPSSASRLLRERELRPKRQVLMGLLGEILGVTSDHPAVARCAVSVIAPLVMMLLASPQESDSGGAVSGSDPEELVAHFQRFALGGLAAIADQIKLSGVRGRAVGGGRRISSARLGSTARARGER